ncbi:hypothetical protein [Ekhidna sp.]|uniref:hypothetical protein n=1 Tax=Ekhidna sp. TaxID=2608089 RepID=UPI003B509516
MSFRKIILAISHLLFISSISGQIYIPGDFFNRIDKTDSTTLTLYKSIHQDGQSQFSLINPFAKFSNNSEYARGYNDGPVWKGKAWTVEAHAGMQGKVGKFHYTFFPVAFYSRNIKFRKALSSDEVRYQFSNQIDWVQQYGFDQFVKFHPGQSEVKFQLNKFNIALSTQNYSLGPSIFNPIILSRQAGGFPHLRFGFDATDLNIGKSQIGKVEANIIMGLLNESDYFDDIEENDRRYINILALGFSPNFLPELTLGLNKSLYKQTRYFEGADLLSLFYILDDGVLDGDTLSPNDAFDQMVSITMDWNFKKVGFRAYAEFAKNDFTSDGGGLRPTAIEPEHTRAYTIGFEKSGSTRKGRAYTFGYEHTNLSANQAPLWRATPSYYTHSVNRNGYTHDGQILGAGIGPGGNSDHFHFKIDYGSFLAGSLIQRIEHNRDYFVANIANFFSHDIEYSLGIFFQKETPKFIFSAEGIFSYNYNRNFGGDRSNRYLSLGVRYKLD